MPHQTRITNKIFNHFYKEVEETTPDLCQTEHPSHSALVAFGCPSSSMLSGSSNPPTIWPDWDHFNRKTRGVLVKSIKKLLIYYWNKNFTDTFQSSFNKFKYAHPWSRIFSGTLLPGVLQIFGNCVFLSISMTSKFLLSSSPSFSPDAKWLHTKQKLVRWKDMLTEIQPCNQTTNRKMTWLMWYTKDNFLFLFLKIWCICWT